MVIGKNNCLHENTICMQEIYTDHENFVLYNTSAEVLYRLHS